MAVPTFPCTFCHVANFYKMPNTMACRSSSSSSGVQVGCVSFFKIMTAHSCQLGIHVWWCKIWLVFCTSVSVWLVGGESFSHQWCHWFFVFVDANHQYRIYVYCTIKVLSFYHFYFPIAKTFDVQSLGFCVYRWGLLSKKWPHFSQLQSSVEGVDKRWIL